MLTILVKGNEYFDEQKSEFVTTKDTVLNLEHSLISLQKWESKWHKPFLTSKNEQKSNEELLDYIRCMTLNTGSIPDMVYLSLTDSQLEEIGKYINDPMTATTFSGPDHAKSNEVITAEIIYYDMIALNIPTEYRKWHLNQLMTLIKVCSIKNEPPKKMSKSSIMRRNSALNAARRKAANSRG